MSNCNTCKKSIRQSDKIVCTHKNCARPYHYLCIGLSADNAKKTTSWTCPLCISKQPKIGDNSDTPVKSTTELSPNDTNDGAKFVTTRKPNPSKISHSQESSVELRSEVLNSLKDELQTLIKNAVKSELSTLKSQISTIESTLNYFSTQYDDLMKTLSSTTTEIKNLRDENVRLRIDVDLNAARLHSLEEELARQQQWSRLQNIEVAGVPESKDEDTVGIVIKLAEKMGISMASTEVEFAHRVQARRPSSSANGRSIIARFRYRSTKDSIVAAARKHRGIKPSDIGMATKTKSENSIYINEHLTKGNRSLFKDCKIKAKEANFKFIWTKNCRIYVRRNETSPAIPIITSADLVKIG